MQTRPNTAIVLSGGASLGAIQAGMLRALYERGVAADLIMGASVGALNGAFIASRPASVETALELAEVWRGIGRGQIFPLNPLTGFLGFFGARDHLISQHGLRRLVEEKIEFEALENAPTPFHVITTELLSGRELRISRGNAIEAVLASAAIPGVFPPVEWGDRVLIDGGVANNTPIADAIELGAERIYVLPTGNACDLTEAPRGAVAMLLHATSLLIMRRLLVEIELLRDRAELIVLPPPCPLAVAPMDFSHAEELIRRGYEDGRDYLEAAEAGNAAVPADGDARPRKQRLAARGKKAFAPGSQRRMRPKTRRRPNADPREPMPTGDLTAWRQRRLLGAGFADAQAASLARDCGVDLHALIELVESGCPPELAARILSPLDREREPC